MSDEPADGGRTDGERTDDESVDEGPSDDELADDRSADDEPPNRELPERERLYETRVPHDESPVECPYCERPLESETLLTLHKGLDHWDRLDDEEREAFRESYRDENADLRTFRLKMVGLLILLYFAFLFVYSYFTTDPFSAAMVVFGSIPTRRSTESGLLSE